MSCNEYHKKEPPMSYLGWHYDAEQRASKGERQWKCPFCCLYIWQSFFHKKPESLKEIATKRGWLRKARTK